MSRLFVYIIEAYQRLISPYLPHSCRFYPSCSEYTKGAILKKGIIKGTIYGIFRILRCNPLNKGGYDPVR